MSQNPLLTYIFPSTTFAPVCVGVLAAAGWTGLAYWYFGAAAVPVFSNAEFG